MKDVFSIDNFNIIQDSENYYFFRALNKADSNDIKDGITSTNGKIDRIRTDRERYEGKPNYHEDSENSLEEMFDHIKMHHSTDTNCISFTSNSNVGIMYGRVYYKDKYVILKVPKDDIGKHTIFAGSYMVDETEKRIKELIDSKKIDQETIKRIKEVDKIKTQEELDKFIKSITKTTKEKEDMYEKGIDFTSTTDSGDYNALSEEQNFIKNKLVTKINIIGENIIPSVSNQMLIKTIGNAFSSLELTHYKDVSKKEILEVPTEIIDIFSLLQQVPKDYPLIQELIEKIIEYSKNEEIKLSKYTYRNNSLDVDNDYTIEKMYQLTYGDIDYYTAMSTYKKMYYLAKSKLRTQHTVELIKKITNNDSKYNEIIEYIENNTYGIEPDIFTRQSKTKIPISESISLDFNKKERELLDLINDTEDYTLRTIIKDPLTSLRHTLRELSYVEDNNVDQETYYANAIIDTFDWRKLNISKIYHDQRVDIVDKLKKKECVKVYNKIKKQGVKEDDISNVLLTTIIKDKDIDDIDLNDTFTVEELEDFLGYYKIKDTDSLQLRNYQASALENIDELFEENQFAAAVLPTGAGKSFVALAKMLENPNAKMLYLAPNVEILNQIKRYVRDNVVGKANSTGKSLDEIIKNKFPNLELHTYVYLKEDNAKDIREGKYDLIVFDEIHRTGAAEWSKYIEETINNQDKKTKVLGISATPQRDMDYKDMSNIWAERFGYSREDIRKKRHLAVNMDIIEGIRSGYIVHPRVISCAYTLKQNGKLEELKERIDSMVDSEDKKEKTRRYEKLRRDVDKADGIEKILKDNLKEKGKYIVFIPVTRRENGIYEDEDGNKIEAVDAKRFIQAYENQMKQYIFAGRFIDENIEEFKEIEKQLKKKEFSPDVLKWINKEKENIQVLSRIRTLESNNELLSKTNEIAEAILERMDWEELDDSKKGKLLNARTKEYIENYSMSSSYTDTHNTKQLDDFNSSKSNKIKFMFVMNKLNEGVHVKDIDGIIWLRPMDENSKILYLQQLGRCIYGLDPNEEVPEEERPLVIDFVNNTLSVNLAKGDIPEIKDLNALRIIVDYIEQRGNPVLDINSTNKLERTYAKSLKRISNKYNEYISDTNLIEELDFERKDAITEIIKEGSKIDLWHMTFPEEIKSKNDSSKEESEDDILELFSITGIEKDFLELSENVDKSTYISREEKAEEFIKSVHELKRNVKVKSSNNGKSERVFRDGTDQRNFYETERTKYNKIDFTKPLTSEEKATKEIFESMQEAVNQYEISREEKAEEFIKSVHELNRNVKIKSNNNGKSERVFRDGTDQRN
ncbi:MAG: DEAD/DEAH box helicase family protein, partial [Bacilli bacterium]|nr:DEAD/DEAH box helicase family protein [Bacilli bacterium]